ncbi:unnamed protein product [Cunninghamella blakesleeana]
MALQYTSLETIEDSVSVLRGSFISGKQRDISWRKFHIERIYDMVKQNEERFYEALAKDMNKPRTEAFVGDINNVLEECIFYLDNIERLLKDKKVKSRSRLSSLGSTSLIRRDPLGVVLIFGAWNFPLQLTLIPLIGAIAGGNTVIVKPSEISAHTSALLTELFPLYLESSLFRIVNGGIEESTALLSHKFDHIFYTGSPRVGKIIMTAAAKHLTPVTLELGGKCPAIVTEDASIDNVAQRIAFGKLFNGGQACVAVDYVLIHESKLNAFIDAFGKTVKKWFGDNPKQSKDFARIITETHFNHVSRLINERQSGDIVLGGEVDRAERYIAPTLIANIKYTESVLMEEEIFGPVLPILAFKHIDEAISYVNKKHPPLALYIFSKDKKTTDRILETTQSGGVLINDTLMHQNEYCLPFGGTGNSGMGNYHGEKSIETFTHERSIMKKKQLMEFSLRVRYPPYTNGNLSLLRHLLSTPSWLYYYKANRKGFKFFTILLLVIIYILKRRL